MSLIYPFGLPIALSLVGYNSILTGALIWFKRKDQIGFRYLISSTVVGGWGIAVSFQLNNDLPLQLAHKWCVVGQQCALFIPVTWLHFVLAYVGEVARFKKLLWIAYTVTLAVFPFTFTPLFVKGFQSIVQVRYYPVPGLFYNIFAVIFTVLVGLSFWILYSKWKDASEPEKKIDCKILYIAQFYGFLMGFLSFLPVYGVQFPQYNLLLMPIWQFMLIYAMVRYSLLDVQKIVMAAHRDKLAAIGTLATSINHEIRNPLYVIQGLAQSHLVNFEEGMYETSSQVVTKSNEILHKVAEQSQRAMDIMRRFAVFAKQGVTDQPRLDSVNLSKTLEDILPLVRHELELEKIELIQDIPVDLPDLNVDQRHLEEILFNLIVNACQAIKQAASDKLQAVRAEGNVFSYGLSLNAYSSGREASSLNSRIKISAMQQNGSINITISDTGPGIAQEQLSQIFEPFYTTKSEGTGLGLYITKQLVERNGGKIFVKSRVGEGTAFTLEFKQ